MNIAASSHPGALPSFARRLGWALAHTVLLVSLAVIVIVFASTWLASAYGKHTMIVTGDSMAPTIHAGDAAFLDPTGANSSFEAGDVITFAINESGNLATHRIVSVHEVDGELFFRTRGDANGEPDPNLVPATAVYGKVWYSVPRLGYLLEFVNQLWGRALLFAVPLSIIFALELRSLRQAGFFQSTPEGATV